MSPKAIPDKATLSDFLCFAFLLALIVRLFRIFRFFSAALLLFLLHSAVFCSMPRVDQHVPHILPIEHEEDWDDWLCQGWLWAQPTSERVFRTFGRLPFQNFTQQKVSEIPRKQVSKVLHQISKLFLHFLSLPSCGHVEGRGCQTHSRKVIVQQRHVEQPRWHDELVRALISRHDS